ncbi:MAG: branched-chain amino acid ABC transporter permease [Proteobacteria bacterium]|nr:branched-chain amino acid ABC transporter permease [Pseudomonadota bacterium]NIS69019.1 branched-chain amino acid ABC transporter permease [Pseudomonadota bacterium]
MIWQQFANGLAIGSVYALIALGLTMVYGVLRILHIAHAGVYALGAYVGLFVFRFIPNFWLALAITMVASSFAGVILQRYLYAPLLALPRIVPLIASIGLFIALEEIFRLIAGPYIIAFPADPGLGSIEWGIVRITNNQFLVFLVTFSLLTILWFVMSRTKLGLAMKATSQDLEIASVMGINTERIIATNFLIGSALAGAAGVLVGVYFNSVYPTMGSIPAYKALAIIVLGGLGSIPGTVLGGLLIGLGETLLLGLINIPFPRDALAFIIMIIILMFRPYGLLGKE